MAGGGKEGDESDGAAGDTQTSAVIERRPKSELFVFLQYGTDNIAV
jgi:hypothetical protein